MRQITDLDEMKAIQLDIMKKVHEYCENNGITYFLSHGTLIGALRHKGFIPWDDDIDVFMPRPDYEIFCNSFVAAQQKYSLEIVNSKTEKYFCRPMSKVIDTNTLLIEPNYLCDDPIGVNIDIWPLDGMPKTENERNQHRNRVSFLLKVLYGRILKYKACENYRQKGAHVLFLLISPSKTVARIIRILKKYSYVESDIVSCLVDPYKKNFRREWFDSKCLTPFEDSYFYIPGNAEAVLTVLYGDYMKLPPAELQQPHHVANAFWKD